MKARYVTGEELFAKSICSPEELGQMCCDDELTAWESIDCTLQYSSGSHYREIKECGCHSRTVLPFPFCMEDYYELFKEECEQNQKEISENLVDIYSTSPEDLVSRYPGKVREAYRKDLSEMIFLVRDVEHALQKRDERYIKWKNENEEAYRHMMEKIDGGAVKEEGNCAKPENNPRKRPPVTIRSAAKAIGCSESCIKKWERGEHMPQGYPGRHDLVALQMFAARYKAQKAANRTARNMCRASTGYDVDSYGESDETDS